MSYTGKFLKRDIFKTSVFIPILTIFLCVSACERDGATELIPGSETVAYNSGNDVITVSPDERWLFFWEENPDYRPPEETDGFMSDIRLSSIDMKTGQKTTYRVDHLPKGEIDDGYLPRWTEVAIAFQDACWSEGRCYIDMSNHKRLKDIAFSPCVPEAQVTALATRRICSDCPPAGTGERYAREWAGLVPTSNREGYSIAFSAGKLGQDIYYRGYDGDDCVVFRVDKTGKSEVVVRKNKYFRDTSIDEVRISPDGRYVAYILWSKLESPIPLPGSKNEIFILEIKTGKERKIFSGFRLTTNLIWSADSARLYFGGTGNKAGVYRANVESLFER